MADSSASKGGATVWLQAARLRTLPLAASGILGGSVLGYLTHFTTRRIAAPAYTEHLPWILGLLLLTAFLLQILSNFANDYGDFSKGTDNTDRLGPERTLQAGSLTPKAMLRAMILTGILAFITGVSALYLRFETVLFTPTVGIFVGLGLLGIWAAVKYTVGKNAFGYRGLGDAFVFLFFGPVAVVGMYYVVADFVSIEAWLGALTFGLLAVAVLNLNNMRDIDNDRNSGKNTLVVSMGLDIARTYHITLILLAWGGIIALYLLHPQFRRIHLLWFLPGILFVPHIKKVLSEPTPAALDPELKKVALGTLLLAVCMLVSSFWWTPAW